MADTKTRNTVRLIDIAKEVGVSRAAVGRVLLGTGRNIGVGPETAKRIRKAAERLNYRPNQIARQLSGISSKLVGVFVAQEIRGGRATRLSAVEAEARRRGYRTIIGQTDMQGAGLSEYLDDFAGRSIDAVLYLDTNENVAARLSRLVLTVSSVRPARGDAAAYVELDRAQGSRLAVEHLVERGRSRIGLVEMPLQPGWVHLEREKRRGFLEALRSCGQKGGRNRIWALELEEPDPIARAGRAVEDLVMRKGCDALIATRDRWAVTIIKVLKRRGLSVPDDVAVVGFDNNDYAALADPALTTIDHRHTECARAMIDLMVELIENESVDEERRCVMIPPRLVVRESSSTASAAPRRGVLVGGGRR